MSGPLAGVDKIPWADLVSWTAEPEKVPQRLRALLSADKKTRDTAFRELYVDLYDRQDDQVLSATVYAIPFLLRLSQDPTVYDRGRILGLLHDIGTVLRPDYLLDGYDDTSDLVADEESFPTAHAVVAVRDAWPDYVRLLDDPQPDVRAAAGLLLGVFRPEPEIVVRAVIRAFSKETDVAAKASLLLCLAHYVMGGADLPAELDFAGMGQAATPPLRTAAAISLVLIDRAAAPDWAREELKSAARNKKLELPGLFWNKNRLNAYAARLLGALHA